jgi:hypothetical protein
MQGFCQTHKKVVDIQFCTILLKAAIRLAAPIG